MIEVVSAILIRRDAKQARVLLTQRTPERDYPWHWESPGGKVEAYEDPHEALIREVQEEIGVDLLPHRIADDPLVSAVIGRDGLPPVRVSLYVAHLRSTDNPSAQEGQGMGWFGRSDHSALMLTPGNNIARGDINQLLRTVYEAGL